MSLKLKHLVDFTMAWGHEKKGELKLRREFRKLLKTHTEKMPVFRFSTIFMKTNELEYSLHDIDENKGVSAPG